MKYTATCHKCDRVLDKDTQGRPYRSQAKADQALRMHQGRVHSKTIPTYMGGRVPARQRQMVLANGGAENGPSNVVATFEGAGRKQKGKLTFEQTQHIIRFIQSNRANYPSKQACFTAALAHAGVTGLIRNNSVAVQRYFDKAENADAAPSMKPPKRKYTKRHKEPEAHEIRINFCPNCGCDIHRVAVALAMAKLER